MKQDLKSMTLAEMQDAFAAIGEPKFRAKQVFAWLHRGAVSFDAMTNLSKPLREKLDGLYDITAPSVARKQVSKLDGTIKYLWKLRDGNCVESVVMQYHHGKTVCIFGGTVFHHVAVLVDDFIGHYDFIVCFFHFGFLHITKIQSGQNLTFLVDTYVSH